jgi:hypothetical protein
MQQSFLSKHVTLTTKYLPSVSLLCDSLPLGDCKELGFSKEVKFLELPCDPNNESSLPSCVSFDPLELMFHTAARNKNMEIMWNKQIWMHTK